MISGQFLMTRLSTSASTKTSLGVCLPVPVQLVFLQFTLCSGRMRCLISTIDKVFFFLQFFLEFGQGLFFYNHFMTSSVKFNVREVWVICYILLVIFIKIIIGVYHSELIGQFRESD